MTTQKKMQLQHKKTAGKSIISHYYDGQENSEHTLKSALLNGSFQVRDKTAVAKTHDDKSEIYDLCQAVEDLHTFASGDGQRFAESLEKIFASHLKTKPDDAVNTLKMFNQLTGFMYRCQAAYTPISRLGDDLVYIKHSLFA